METRLKKKRNEAPEQSTTQTYEMDPTVPPIPIPVGPTVIPAKESERVIVETGELLDSIRIKIKYVTGNSSGIVWQEDLVKVNKEDLAVKIQHRRFWSNLGSRLIGPGTEYSISYGWRKGTEESSGSQFSETMGVEVTATAGASGYGFSAEVSTSLSYEMSKSFSSSKTVTQETEGTEVQAVEAKEGYNRVYTVWQLFDEFEFVDEYGDSISYNDAKEAVRKSTDVTTEIILLTPPLPKLVDGTTAIAQSTFDFQI